jgi:hypothetical protein
MTPDEVTLAELDEGARLDAPRMFALYGIFRHRMSDEDDGGYLGWGMEFADPPRAVMLEPNGSTFIAGSAEEILRTHDRLGQARLVWLTEGPDGPNLGDYELTG